MSVKISGNFSVFFEKPPLKNSLNQLNCSDPKKNSKATKFSLPPSSKMGKIT